jgi:hypothetical protein
MYPFIYIQIHMLEVRVKQLENKRLRRRLPRRRPRRQLRRRRSGRRRSRRRWLRRRQPRKRTRRRKISPGGHQEAAMTPINPIRFSRVKRWFKCLICFNHLYQHKNNLFCHIKYMMMDEFFTPDVVEQHSQLNRWIEAAICDP